MRLIFVADAYLNEELGVEGAGSGVEGRSGNVGVDFVLSRDGMRGQQVHKLDGGEACILHASKDALDGVGGLGDEVVGGGARVVGTASHELETGAADTVGGSYSTGEVDARDQALSKRVVVFRNMNTYKSPKETPWANAKGMN